LWNPENIQQLTKTKLFKQKRGSAQAALNRAVQQQRAPLVRALDAFWAKWKRPELAWSGKNGTGPTQVHKVPHGPRRLTVTPFQQETSVILDTGSSNLIFPSTFNAPLRKTLARDLKVLCDDVPINCDGSASISFSVDASGKPVWTVDSPAFATRVYQLRASTWKFDGEFNGDTDLNPLLYDIVPAAPALILTGQITTNNVHPKYSNKCVICMHPGQQAELVTSSFKDRVLAAAKFAKAQGRPLDTNHFADKNGRGVETVRCTSACF
jgi:hypothetical protein